MCGMRVWLQGCDCVQVVLLRARSFVHLHTLTGVGLKLSVLEGERSNCRRIQVVVRAVRVCSILRVGEIEGPKVSLSIGCSCVPGSRQGLICGTTGLLVSRFRIGNNISVRLRGFVPITTNVTNKDSSTTTTLIKVGQLFGLKLDRGRLVSHTIGVKTSIPCYIVEKATLTRKVKRGLAEVARIPSYFMLVNGPKVGISAGTTCRDLRLSGVSSRPSVSKVVKSVRHKSLLTVARGVKGIFRPKVVRGCPMVNRVGTLVRDRNTLGTVVDKDNPAIFKVFSSHRGVRTTTRILERDQLTGAIFTARMAGTKKGAGSG